jgi:surface antigen
MSGKPTFEDLSAFVDGEVADMSGSVRPDVVNDAETAALLAEISGVDSLVRAHYRGEADQPVPGHLVAAIDRGFEKRRARHKHNVWTTSWLSIAASLVIAAFGLAGAFYVAEQRAQTQIAAYEARWKAGQQALEAALQDTLETKASGTEVSFTSGEADIQGSISPTRTYQSQTGHWCREFSEIVESGGVREHRRGLACREDSGGWQRLETTISGKPGFRLTQ